MHTSFSQPKILGTVVGSLLALALVGCGDDGSKAESQAAAQYDGTGTEALGTYVGRVSDSSGLYDEGHYAPRGLTQHVELSLSGTDLYLDLNSSSNGASIPMSANPENGTYRGTVKWTPNSPEYGMLQGEEITEIWTLSFSGEHVELSVTGNTRTSSSTGSLRMELTDSSYSFDDSESYYFSGRITSDSDDKRYVGGITALELSDNDPGTYGYFYNDETYGNEYEYYYFDAFIKNGDTLTAGGFIDSGEISDATTDIFATLTVQLDSLGRPSSTELMVHDFDNMDDDGFLDNEPTSYTVHADSYLDYDLHDFFFPSAAAATLHVDSVTAGGLLEAKFGIIGTNNVGWYDDEGDYVYLDAAVGGDWYIYYGFVSPTQRSGVLWDKRSNDYYNDTQDYELDSSDSTNERVSIDITYNALKVATGGTVKLEVFDRVSDKLLSAEDMAFTVTP